LSRCPIPQMGITKGDKLCLSIACASVVAKVTRDRIMEEFDRVYPGYGFASHKGYGTRKHISSLQKLGPSPIHRLYFAPVRNVIAGQSSGSLTPCHSAGAERVKNPTQGKLREGEARGECNERSKAS
jgi:ribonuclease HII